MIKKVEIKGFKSTSAEVKIKFQDGYGIKSTFASEPEKLARMLVKYYSLNTTDESTTLSVIQRLGC